MASAGTWISSEVEKGILLSETEENGIITRTYISPFLEPKKEVEIPDPLASSKEFPMPYFCPHCGNGIGSSGAFTMHIRACQRRVSGVDHKEELPAKFEPQPASREHPKLAKSYPTYENCSRSILSPFQCIFCRKEFKVQFEVGQVRRRYACDNCGQKARAEEAERQKNPNDKKKTLICDRCGKLYKLEGFLVRHQMLCQGLGVKRKREYSYKIHEVAKKKSEENGEVPKDQLNNEIQGASKFKQKVGIPIAFDVKLESENHVVTKIKHETDECHADS